MSSTRGFRILPSYYDAIRAFPDDQRLILWDAIMDYGCADIWPERLPPACNAVFVLIQPTLQKSVKYFIDQQTKAQDRQDSIRQSAGRVPEKCRDTAEPMPEESRERANDVGGNMRDGDSERDCDRTGEGGGDFTATAASILKVFGVKDTLAMRNAIAEDLKTYGEQHVRDCLLKAVNADNRGGVSPNFYLAFSRGKPAVKDGNYLHRDYGKKDFAGMYEDLTTELETIRRARENEPA